MFENLINEILTSANNESIWLKEMLKQLFANEDLKSKYVNEIRRSTIIWQIANEALLRIWSKDSCKILAIWDIKYFWELEEKWNSLVSKSLWQINPANLSSYDLTSQWSSELRTKLKDYMWLYYNLENFDYDIIDNIIPFYWWTDAFVTILDSIKSLHQNQKINFIFPEASFMANVKIAESILWEQSLIKINKISWNNFFFELSQLKKIGLWIDDINIYYITTVGNPTGQKLLNENFYEILDYLSTNENNIVILDNVYVWLLQNSVSTAMFDRVFSNYKILEKIIFVESLSKTLWTTWIRIGWSWSVNEKYIWEIKKNTILKKAWFSKILNEFSLNLLWDLEEIKLFQNEVYDFWSWERLKFLDFIKNNYSHFFDFESSSRVNPREGIYVFLKVKTWFSIEEIFAETWIIWVWINLSDWLYIRYAFGNVNYY